MNNQQANGLHSTRTAVGKSLRLIAVTGIFTVLSTVAFGLHLSL